MSIDAIEIVRELVESIEEKNYYHGEKVERMKTEHREEIKKIREEKREVEYQLELRKHDVAFHEGQMKNAEKFAKELMTFEQFKIWDERLNK